MELTTGDLGEIDVAISRSQCRGIGTHGRRLYQTSLQWPHQE